MANILAVDDMRSMRDLVKSVLEKRGHTVTTQDDGQTALEFAQSNNVDLVISDINMPVMNGITLVESLRALSGYKNTPILMLTTEDAADKKNQAKAAGANGWIQKPFNPERLVNAVDRTLSKN
ncbi:MAG: response regulator [Gammaproteobacteria bacterium]|nr:response regulator [Gammaproteobacteria bacterium]